MTRKLLTVDEFRSAARTGARPDGTVLRLTSADPVAAADGSRRVRFTFSDGTIDRAGDSIDPKGWVLDNFNKNPVILWAHDSWSPPIGRGVDVSAAGDALVGDVDFMPPEINGFADTVYRMVKAGYIKAGSVGFLPLEWTFVNDKDRPYGINFEKQELLEFSICPVPCNPNALQEARSKGIDTAPLAEWAERLLDRGGSVLVPRDFLAETFKAAKTPKATRQKYLRPKAAADWKVGAARDLPLDQSDAWDGPAAAASIFAHAGGDEFNPEVARKGFLVYDAAEPKLRGSYKEPFAHVVDGTLKAVKGGIKAAASRLPQADISDSAKTEARAVIDHYEKAFGIGEEPEKAIGDDDAPTGAEEPSTAPTVRCKYPKDQDCGMQDPQQCATHYVPPAPPKSKSGRRISAANKALLEKALESHLKAMDHHADCAKCIKDVLDSNDPAVDDPEGDDDDDPDKQRAQRIAAARRRRAALTPAE